MRIKGKLYPYPVLAPTFNNDYVDSDFNIEIISQLTPNEVVLNFVPILSNKGLKKLINEGKANFIVHIECALTSYREIIKISEEGLTYKIPADKIEGVVYLCPFIIATQDINGYVNEKFNEDYSNTAFDIEKGNILAVGQEASFFAEKENDDLSNVPSIFAVTEVKDPERKGIVIDNTGNKINIQLPEKEFTQFKIAMNNPATMSIIHSMIIIPALMKCFEDLKNPELFQQHIDKRWARAIKKAVKKLGYEFDRETILSLNSFEISQKIMDNTICRGIIDIQNIAKLEGDDE